MYDELLTGLGDGMAAGLENGLGDRDNDTVFRRSFSALLLAECVARDNQQRLLARQQDPALGRPDRRVVLREHDLRGCVPGKGWAHTMAHGADALGALARSAAFDAPELTVLLDVLADRLLLPTEQLFVAGEPDRMAAGALQVLRRNLVPLERARAVGRPAGHAAPSTPARRRPRPVLATNVQAFLRALHLQLALAPQPAGPPRPAAVLVDALRAPTRTTLTGE